MASYEYDVVFVGGGLAATLLQNELRSAWLGRVAVVEPWPPSERPPVHWSYWSREPTPYDRFAVGVWRWARVADAQPEPIAPYDLRLVRSTDVLAPMIEAAKELPVERLRTTGPFDQAPRRRAVRGRHRCRNRTHPLGVRQCLRSRSNLSVAAPATSGTEWHRHPRQSQPAGVRCGNCHPVRPSRRAILRLLGFPRFHGLSAFKPQLLPSV